MKFQGKKQTKKKTTRPLIDHQLGSKFEQQHWEGAGSLAVKLQMPHSTPKFTCSGETVTHRHRPYVSMFRAVLFPRVDTGSNFNVRQLAMDYYKGILHNRAQQTCSGPEGTHFAFVSHLSLYCRFCSFFFFLATFANVKAFSARSAPKLDMLTAVVCQPLL